MLHIIQAATTGQGDKKTGRLGSADPKLRPNLFIIGASKAGSSALHAYLRRHPDIGMSQEKEPCYFVDRTELTAAWPIMARKRCSYSWNAYLSLWEGAQEARYRGEGSVYYSQAPHRSGVAERIARACPDARIIYLVREPVQRAVAHYWQRFKEFQEVLPIEEAMREHAIYRDTSDYALQLEAYLAHFDPSRIRVIVAEELRLHRREQIDAITDWLELPRGNYSDDELAEVHRSPPTSRRQRFPMVGKVRDSALWAHARDWLPKSIVRGVRHGATVHFSKAEVDETGARAFLATYLAPRRERFEAMIGRKVTAWDKVR